MNKTAITHYGLMAEFETAELLLKAVRESRLNGYQAIEAYTPFPVEGLDEALGLRRDLLPFFALVGGCLGAISIYFVEYYSATINYPINSGGRPYHSWLAFIPPAVEMAILGAALAVVFGMLILNGLPKLHHPLFDVSQFEMAERDRFFLCLGAHDPLFDEVRARRFLESLEPLSLHEVKG
ncbi:DUF3341 domain-containing protein [Nitrosococcus watsonii]|uniref:Transmembrane prediction n=1 Tax=Nitrosococcus watsoni (strain C-113) TaxID=105559 RepID=D8K585_NITWC|nr:DUF3341 domain-containing protein [Nitrosococcus watsonii]ADJ28062.1 transmembrane prediction [Nitrosococcus watsonii C-113]